MVEAVGEAPEFEAGATAATQRRYVGYYRMSTQAQARFGFSLEAQQAAVASYVAANAGKVIAEYAETKSGRNNRRPKIAEALQVCRIFGAVLLIARLDRLSRNVAMIARLIESKVEFVAIDFPHATRLTLHVLAAIAEHESRMMSDRIRSARAARGRDAVRPKSGKANRLFPPGSRAISAQVRHDRSQARIKDLAPLIWKAIDEGKSYAMIAEEFNRQGIRPAQHKAWQQDSIGAIARATGADFQPRPPARHRSPPGLRRAKMLERVAEIGSLMLGWRAHGLSYAGIARELERRGVASPCGGAWGGQSISRYLIVAAAIASCQGPIGAVG